MTDVAWVSTVTVCGTVVIYVDVFGWRSQYGGERYLISLSGVHTKEPSVVLFSPLPDDSPLANQTTSGSPAVLHASRGCLSPCGQAEKDKALQRVTRQANHSLAVTLSTGGDVGMEISPEGGVGVCLCLSQGVGWVETGMGWGSDSLI